MSTSSPTSLTASRVTTEDPGLGTLIKLPREIRDEIYRYLVKGTYHLLHPVPFFVSPRQWRKPDMFDPTPLHLSKTIHHEAAEVYFSESSFAMNLFHMEGMVKLPQQSFDRMMSLAFLVRCDEWDPNNDNRAIWETTIQQISGARAVRGNVHVIFDIQSSLKYTDVPNHIFYSSRFLNKYRMVYLEVFIAYGEFSRDMYEFPAAEEAIKQCNEEGDLLIAAVLKDLEPSLGPAILHRPTSQPATACRQDRISFMLEFHPQDHIEKIERAAKG